MRSAIRRQKESAHFAQTAAPFLPNVNSKVSERQWQPFFGS